MTQQISEIGLSICPTVTFQFRLHTIDGEINDFNIEVNEDSVHLSIVDKTSSPLFLADFEMTPNELDKLLTTIANSVFRHIGSSNDEKEDLWKTASEAFNTALTNEDHPIKKQSIDAYCDRVQKAVDEYTKKQNTKPARFDKGDSITL